MSTVATQDVPRNGIATPWHAGFLAILPTVERHARVVFRYLPPHELEECVAEATAASMIAYLSLVRRGRLYAAYPSTIALFAAKRVQNGRHVGTAQSKKDVLSPLARRSKGFSVASIDDHQPDSLQRWRDILIETRNWTR